MPPSLRAAVLAEFIGTFLFQLVGGSEGSPEYNGVVLAIVIFMTCKASGGVVNPAVATGLLTAGELSSLKWALYVAAELAGAAFGALLAGVIDSKCFEPADQPELTCLRDYSNFNNGPGCVPDSAPEAWPRVWLWEFIGTFMLVSTVFATAVAKPGFGNLAPVAIGASVFINIGSSGSITGGAYNPARYFGPAIAFGCRLQLFWLYWSAQCLAGIVAALFHTHVLKQFEVDVASSTRGLPSEQSQALSENDSAKPEVQLS